MGVIEALVFGKSQVAVRSEDLCAHRAWVAGSHSLGQGMGNMVRRVFDDRLKAGFVLGKPVTPVVGLQSRQKR